MEIRFTQGHDHALLARLLPQPDPSDKKIPKAGDIKVCYGAKQPELLAVLGGRRSRFDLHKLVAKIIAFCRKEGFATLTLDLSKLEAEVLPDLLYSVGYAGRLADYAFDRYLSEKKDNHVAAIALLGAAAGAGLEAALAEGEALGRAVNFARDLANERSHVMTPLALADAAAGLPGVELEVLLRDDMKRLGMGGLLGVSQGAHHPPAFIILRYTGDPSGSRRLGIVGKGITYDSGGLSLKPAASMIEMHNDMSGAAATLGAMQALAGQKVRANVTAVIPACENLPGAQGYRPGDILTLMAGKTVIVKSTDAEGRLVMADALTWLCREEKVDCLMDVATLTGAAAAVCGPLVVAAALDGGFSPEALDCAAGAAGNLLLKMPLPEDYMKYIRDEQADLSNTTGGPVGMIGAALFLREFTEQRPWLHLDIAGSATASPPTDLDPSGTTGIGTALLYHLVRSLAQDSGF